MALWRMAGLSAGGQAYRRGSVGRPAAAAARTPPPHTEITALPGNRRVKGARCPAGPDGRLKRLEDGERPGCFVRMATEGQCGAQAQFRLLLPEANTSHKATPALALGLDLHGQHELGSLLAAPLAGGFDLACKPLDQLDPASAGFLTPIPVAVLRQVSCKRSDVTSIFSLMMPPFSLAKIYRRVSNMN